MRLRLDTDRVYALALEGGGAKGGYQIGVWRALREAGIRLRAVAGTSVGAMNGALISMGDLEKAENVWRNIHFSQVMDVDDELMHKLIRRDLRGLDISQALSHFKSVVANRGYDVSPLYNWISEVVDEEQIRASDIELFITTVSLSEQKELELRAKELAPGTLNDMLLASAYLPVFRNEPLGGKRYADGGFRDVLPLHILIERGFRDIIAVRLFGAGVERKVKIPDDTNIYTIQPTADLGGTLSFEPEQSRFNMRAGYFDAQRLLYGLWGREWYLDGEMSEDEAYGLLIRQLRAYYALQNTPLSLLELNEEALPLLAKRLDAGRGDYRYLLVSVLEAAAGEAGLERWRIYALDEFIAALTAAYPEGQFPRCIAEALRKRFSLR